MSTYPNMNIITVYISTEQYQRFLRDNPSVNTNILNPTCNTVNNYPIPKRYNEFLDGYDYNKPSWFVFCHEDFEFQESIEPLLQELPADALYGPIGCTRKGIFPFRHQVFLGQLTEQNRDGTGKPWQVGQPVPVLTPVETFDCCCLIVHSTLIEKHHLRFDEELAFDLYVEDFCAMAKVKHGIQSRILPFKATHHSGSKPTERLYRHLPYLATKYPDRDFCASCTYFGTPDLTTKALRRIISAFR